MKIWKWLSLDKNRKVLGWVGVGVLTVAAYFGIGKKEEKPITNTMAAPALAKVEVINPQIATADRNAISVNASDNAKVNIK